MGRLNERSSDFDEVFEVPVGLSGSAWSSGLSLVLPNDISEDFGPSVIGDFLTGSKIGLLLGDGFVEERLDLILKWSLASLSKFGSLVELLELEVVGFVSEELEWVDVVRHELKFSVSLIGESSGTTVLNLLGWGLRGERDQEELSESQDESLLDIVRSSTNRRYQKKSKKYVGC